MQESDRLIQTVQTGADNGIVHADASLDFPEHLNQMLYFSIKMRDIQRAGAFVKRKTAPRYGVRMVRAVWISRRAYSRARACRGGWR